MPDATPISDASTSLQAWRLKLAYDGTDFAGWQVQPGLPTIQGSLASAIRSVTSEEVLPQGSGRTDAGVHALGQVVSLKLAVPIPPDNLKRALNRILPTSIRVLEAGIVAPEFHARRGVLSKTYRYTLFLCRPTKDVEEIVCSPERARWVWQYPAPLDVAAMMQAAERFVGTHDFTSFAANDPERKTRLEAESNAPDNIRTLYSSAWTLCGDELSYQVRGSGFLHHMVRNLVGTCVDVGAGRILATEMEKILVAKNRGAAGPTAPPQGLSLLEVEYGSEDLSDKDKRA
ncbi:Pseudouridine synthase I, TruA, alpha/beta domain protein [Terriglobus saanensis SP1PR4]|uniref:tRNA pseudouridine synthase A n=1 Tax=Terriglobus saanensis (strain ATCC BAA-1853 / DSM 23119 / SP1PR4) TaxID=401053 RepID=E8V7A7_TERSS|nr:Pseudouridine synthase I, TruA, alpha/beta domain protein [Terriglobus saanensis SP1PR4]